MRYLKSFQEFENNESLKSNIFAGAIGLGTVLGGSKAYSQDNKTKEQTYITKSKNDMLNHKYNGWKLDSIHVDTIIKEIVKAKPQIVMKQFNVDLKDDNYYKSGNYKLNDVYKEELNKIIDSIFSNDYVVINIVIESSTDKQNLSINLKNELIKNGFTGDNKGLSNARCFYIGEYLSKFYNDTIIKKDIKFEKGDNIIDSDSRYVKITFNCIYEKYLFHPYKPTYNKDINKTYYLHKDPNENKKVVKLKHNNIKSKELTIPIIDFKINDKLKCYYQN